MATKAPTKTTAPTKAPAKSSETSQTTESKSATKQAQHSTEKSTKTQAAHQPSGSAGVPLPPDPSAVLLQEEQDELQQPGRVSKHVADQIDNDPGYSKDQLNHMSEYWADDDE